jgi:uncharacterized protein (DUF885 family)
MILVVGLAWAESASERLARLGDEYWQGELRANPVQATALGDRRFDHLLSDNSDAGRARESTRLARLRADVAAISLSELSPEERVTHSVLLEVVDGDLAVLECGFHDWVVDPLGGPQISLQNIPAVHSVETPEQAGAMVQRWQAIGPYIDQHTENIRAGLAKDRVMPAKHVERVLEQLDDLLSKDLEDWALLSPLKEEHESWADAQRERFAADMRSAVADGARPALERYRDFVRESVLPVARPQDRVGVVNVQGGAECYAAMIRRHTSLDLSAEEIHQIGLRESERIMNEMRELGQKSLGTSSLAETLERLRSDPKLYFETRDGVEDKAREALARAREAMPGSFGILPQAPCEVVRMEPHEEKHSTIAYYRQPALDGSRPGRYYINTYAPETRPRYEAEALAFHEAIPGHHLQIAIAQELQGIPEFRKHTGTTAFVEGWGLYTERLSDEMGLYSGDLDRIGMLSYEAWRACRLVVDTGMHALGWSRQQAIDFMLANSALAENNIVNEVDRYIAWPGQALAYKLGQLEILSLRTEVKRKTGDDFDIREFHDVVLRNGAVSLTTLGQIVREHYGIATARR